MTRRRFQWLALVAVLVLAGGSGSRAEGPRRVTFSGLINDYTVASVGSWEIHGVWSLTTKERSGRADFSAVLTMERSDYWLVTTPGADPNNAATRNAHTHHIDVTDATVTPITGGFRVMGPATITANGGIAPFGTSSSVVVDITGGSIVAFSNLKLTFGGDAITHFGSPPLAGVVRRWK